MKVVELMEDLETGDRTMEHLAKRDEPMPQGISGSLTDAFRSVLGSAAFDGMSAMQSAQMQGLSNVQQRYIGQANMLGYASNTTGFGR